MTIIRLKSKNQLTIPMRIIKKLGLHEDEFFQIVIKENQIRLIPVEVKPRHTERN